jgi:hypothetical protein
MELHPHNLGVIVCNHVLEESRPILLAVHEAEGWNFACGGSDHSDDDFHNVCIGHLTGRDPSLNACTDLPVGFVAERPGQTLPWARAAIDPGES